jgi:CBS domain-containing protein
MPATLQAEALSVLFLDGKTAAELMTPKVVSIAATAPLEEAAAALTERKFGAVPVTDADGRAIGVVSRTDVVAHDCRLHPLSKPGQPPGGQEGSPVLPERALQVQDIMTPVVYSVPPEAEAKAVVTAMLSLGVHRLFVRGADGALLGVISTTDLLRHLHEPLTLSFDQVEVLCPNAEAFKNSTEGLAGSGQQPL